MPKRGVVDKYSPQKASGTKKVSHPVNDEIDYAEELESLDDPTPREPDNLRKSADLDFEDIHNRAPASYERPHAPTHERPERKNDAI